MAQTAPTPATPLGPVPTTADPANFDFRADNFLAALPTYQTELNGIASNVYGNAVDAFNSATAAAGSAADALASAANALDYADDAAAYAGATLWVSGLTYAVRDVRISPIDDRLYRRLTTGAGVIDPSNDPTNWKVFQYSKPIVTVTGTTVTAQSGKHYLLKNVGLTTVAMPASMSEGDEVEITVGNTLETNVVNPNGKTIEGTSGNMTIDRLKAHFTLRYIDSDLKVN